MKEQVSKTSAKLRHFCEGLFAKHHQSHERVFSVGEIDLGVANDYASLTKWMQAVLVSSDAEPDAQITCAYGAVDYSKVSRWHNAPFAQRVMALSNAGYRGFLNDETSVLELFDCKTNKGLRVLPDPGCTPMWESTAPIANFAAWSNATAGAVMLHAAVVGTSTDGALLCGPGGSGKSLLTLAATLGGLSTVGDDYVIVNETSNQGFQAKPYSPIAKQSVDGLRLLGEKGAHVSEGTLNWSDKRCFPIDDLAQGMFALTLPVNSVVSVRLGQSPSIEPLAPRVAFNDIVRSTEHQIPAMIDMLFPFVGNLTRQCPVYRLTLGPDVHANVAALRSLISAEDTA